MKITSLDRLPINNNAKILNVECENNLKRRLLDLGLINGTNIKSVFKSPMGNPVAYLVKGSTIAIRKEDSKYITIKYDGGNYGAFF